MLKAASDRGAYGTGKMIADLLPSKVIAAARPEKRTSYGWATASHRDVERYNVRTVTNDEVGASVDILRALTSKSDPKQCLNALSRMKVVLASRDKGVEETTAQLKIMSEYMSNYPHDVVISACHEWINSQKFFPVWKELRDIMEEHVRRRRLLLAALVSHQANGNLS